MIDLIGQSEFNEFGDKLAIFGLIDVGTITGYQISSNKAEIDLFSLDKEGNKIHLKNVEVMLPGSIANGFQHELINAHCLVFWPRSIVPSLQNDMIMNRASPYSVQGVKCLPFSVMPSQDLSVGFDNFGNFSLGNAQYVIQLSKNGITYQNADGTSQFALNTSSGESSTQGAGKLHTSASTDGTKEIYYETNNGKVAYRMVYTPSNGTYKIQRGAYEAWSSGQEHDNYTKYAWAATYEMDGSVTIKQQNSNAQLLNNIAIDAEGNITITQQQAENTIKLKQDGTLSIETASDVKVDSAGEIKLKGTQGASLDADEGMLTLKNASYSIKEAFDDLITALNSFQVSGSMGSSTAVPGQFVNLKSKLAQLW